MCVWVCRDDEQNFVVFPKRIVSGTVSVPKFIEKVLSFGIYVYVYLNLLQFALIITTLFLHTQDMENITNNYNIEIFIVILLSSREEGKTKIKILTLYCLFTFNFVKGIYYNGYSASVLKSL